MLDEVLAALKGADPFEAKYHVSEAEAQRILAEQWRELDRLAASDPAAYGRHLEAVAKEAGSTLPSGWRQRVTALAAEGGKGDGLPSGLPLLIVRASIPQPEGVIAPAAPKELAAFIYPHTAGKLPPAVLASGRPVSAVLGRTDSFNSSSGSSSRIGVGIDSTAEGEWLSMQVVFAQHQAPSVQPPRDGRPALALNHLECDAALLQCAVLAQPEAARRAVVMAAVREVEQQLKMPADYRSIRVQVPAAAAAPAASLSVESGRDQAKLACSVRSSKKHAQSPINALLQASHLSEKRTTSSNEAPLQTSKGLPGALPDQEQGPCGLGVSSSALHDTQPLRPVGASAAVLKQRPLIQEVSSSSSQMDGGPPPAASAGDTVPQEPAVSSTIQVAAALHHGRPCLRVTVFGVAGVDAADVRVNLHGGQTLRITLPVVPGQKAAVHQVELPSKVSIEGVSARLDTARECLVVRLPCSSLGDLHV